MIISDSVAIYILGFMIGIVNYFINQPPFSKGFRPLDFSFWMIIALIVSSFFDFLIAG